MGGTIDGDNDGEGGGGENKGVRVERGGHDNKGVVSSTQSFYSSSSPCLVLTVRPSCNPIPRIISTVRPLATTNPPSDTVMLQDDKRG